ncbi:hypothetical protein SNE40_010765 [Patella caerulea]|uniref:Nucleolus and neural progenitor protein-like N-terminal domain-containing protein n=1 Tax=Patella caerulea TaxID=87958 RepID=A0AAN8PS02_PATCE
MSELTPLWNQKFLKPPLICIMKTEITSDNIAKLKSIKQVLNKCSAVLQDDSVLLSEIETLSRLIYKRGLQLRREKTMQYLKQINKCMKKYLDMKLKEHTITFTKDFNENEFKRGISVYLPSRQMLEHLLVQYISVAMLLSQTVNYCVNAFIWCKMNLEHGHLVPQYLIFISITSRIWAIYKCLYLNVIKWYEQLLHLRFTLQPTQVEWLSSTDVLAKDLDVFVKSQITPVLQPNSKIDETKMDIMMKKYFSQNLDDNKGENLDMGNPEMSSELVGDNEGDGMMEEELEEEIVEDMGAPVSRQKVNNSPKIKENKKKRKKELSISEIPDTDVSTENTEESHDVSNSSVMEESCGSNQDLRLSVEQCKSFKNLIKILNTCFDVVIPNKQKKCLGSVKLLKSQYHETKQKGDNSQKIKEKLLQEAKQNVNVFVTKYIAVQKKRSKVNGKVKRTKTSKRVNDNTDVESHGESSKVNEDLFVINNIQENAQTENRALKVSTPNNLKLKIHSLKRLKNLIDKVEQNSELVLERTKISLNKKQRRLILKKLKVCHQKYESGSFKKRKKEQFLLKASRDVEVVLQKSK